MPRLEDALAYASIAAIAVGVALGLRAAWLGALLMRGAEAQQLCMVGGAVCLAGTVPALLAGLVGMRREADEDGGAPG